MGCTLGPDSKEDEEEGLKLVVPATLRYPEQLTQATFTTSEKSLFAVVFIHSVGTFSLSYGEREITHSTMMLMRY